MRNTSIILGGLLIITSALPQGQITALAADQWTNLSGTNTVSGDLVGLWNGRVLLRLDGGRRVAVKMGDLRADSRIQAEKRLEELTERMREQSAAIRMHADEASAPAPKTYLEGRTEEGSIGSVPDAPEYRPVDEGADLEMTLTSIRDQILAGHLRILYDTLPATQQQAVDQWFKTMVSKVDGGSFDSGREAMASLGELILSRQSWLMSHPRMAQLEQSDRDELLEQAFLMRQFFSEEVMGIEQLRSRPFGESLAKLNDLIAPHLHAGLNDPSTGFASMAPNIQVEALEEGKMVGKLVLPFVGPLLSQNFVASEDRWAFGDSPDTLTVGLRAMTEQLESLPNNSIALPASMQSIAGKVSVAVTALEQAKTRQEFHRQLDQIMPELAEIVNEWSGFDPAAMGVAGQNPPGMGGMFPGMAGGMAPGMSTGMAPGMDGMAPGMMPAMTPSMPATTGNAPGMGGMAPGMMPASTPTMPAIGTSPGMAPGRPPGM